MAVRKDIMTSKYDKAFDLLKQAIDGIEKLGYFTHDECFDLATYVNQWLEDKEENENEDEENKNDDDELVDYAMAMGEEGV